MRVTAFLLERRGYDIVQDGSVHVAEAAARWRADVVVVETDSSRASTARLLAALEALSAPPAIVAIYSDGGVERLPEITTVAKWAPVDDLARQIDAASLRRPAAPGSRSTRSSL
jgi:hypothetical protein